MLRSGLNEAVGILLREQRERLPSLRSYRAAASERRRQNGREIRIAAGMAMAEPRMCVQMAEYSSIGRSNPEKSKR